MSSDGGRKKISCRLYFEKIMNRFIEKSGTGGNPGSEVQSTKWQDYIKFVIFIAMLLVPVYAIAHSAINHDWIMMIIDALFVPVGFVHGLLLLFGIMN